MVQLTIPPGANLVQLPNVQNGQIDHKTLGSKIYNQGYEQEFLTFWSAYPLHRAKRIAQLAWSKAVQRVCANGATRPEAIAQILAGAIAYRDDPARLDEFTRHGATWLNGDGWEDDPLPTRIDRSRPVDPPRPMTSGEMDQFIDRALGKEKP